MSRTPRHSTVVAYLALVTALSTGGAYAAGQIGAHDIKKDAVRSKHIKDGQVRTQDLALDSVTSAQVAPGTLTGADVTDNSLTGADVTDNSLTGADILESSLGQVPNASTLAGRAPTTFVSSTVYKRESAVAAGTDLGDGTFVADQACDPGDLIVAGGPANVNPTSDMVESFPSPGSTTTWTARINKHGVADNFSVVILCFDQTP